MQGPCRRTIPSNRDAAVSYVKGLAGGADILCQWGPAVTIVGTASPLPASKSGLGLNQALAQAVHQFTVLGGQVVHEAIDSFDDDTPLRQAGDR